MALITIPLLPFGVIEQLKFLSEKTIGTMFNLAIKIFVVAFIATLSLNILTGLLDNARETATSSDFIGNISYFLQVLLYALILFYMTKKIPELVSGLIIGQSVIKRREHEGKTIIQVEFQSKIFIYEVNSHDNRNFREKTQAKSFWH